MMEIDFPPVMEIPHRRRPVDGVVRPPGSKSITNRALVIAALARGVSRLEGPLQARDTEVMRAGLRQLGVLIDDVDDPWLVLGTAGVLSAPDGVLDVGASGTTARFITAVASLAPGPVRIDGTERMRERPIDDLAMALRQAGAQIQTTGGFFPLTIGGGGLSGGVIHVDVSRSSQYLSALLMVAPLAEAEMVISTRGEMVSGPYVQTTLEVMEAFGGVVQSEGGRSFRVRPGGYRATHLEIEADASAAVYPMAAAAITGGVVGIEGLVEGSTQADLAVGEVLEEMGCRVLWLGARLVVEGPADGVLRGADRDMSSMPDGALGISVVCLFARGPSRLRGLGTLRLKETDRLAALGAELSRAGAEAQVEGDDLIIRPGRLRPARFHTYDDHRMAMSFALVGLRQPGVEILDPGCVTKTWPGYFTMLERLHTGKECGSGVSQ